MFLEESAFCRGFREWIVIRSEDYFYLKEADKFPSPGITFCGLWFRGEWARQRPALELSDGGWVVELWSSMVFCENSQRFMAIKQLCSCPSLFWSCRISAPVLCIPFPVCTMMLMSVRPALSLHAHREGSWMSHCHFLWSLIDSLTLQVSPRVCWTFTESFLIKFSKL